MQKPGIYIVLLILLMGIAGCKKETDQHVGYRNVDDLKDKRIAVLMGTMHDKYVTANYPEAEIIRSETYSDMLMTLTMGKCEAMVLNHITYASMTETCDKMALLDSCLYVDQLGIGFQYEQNELKEQFNQFLQEARQSGLYDEIKARWLDHTKTAKMPDFPPATSGKTLRIGTTASSMPFTFVRDGKNAGLDVELLTQFAHHINYSIEFLTINFGGLISALSSGRVDVIAAALTITPERAKKVNFSDSYLNNRGVMAVLKENMAQSTTVEVKNQGFFTRIADSFYHNILAEKRYMLILSGLGITLLISICASILGTLFGAGICYLRMSRSKLLKNTSKAYISLMRGLPVLVLLMLMYYVVFASWDVSATVVAIIAFALNFAAYVSEMFRTSIESIDRGQTEAGIALGFNKIQTFGYIIMPQAVKRVLPVYKGELISLIKMTSVVGYIAVSDLTKASDIIRSRTFDAFFPLIMVAVLYFLLAWAFASLLDYFTHKNLSRQ